MLFLRARYYNPADGRFQSRDTWSGDINHPVSYNRWAYAYSNPTNLTHPSGNCPQCIAVLGLGLAGGAVGGTVAYVYANYMYDLAESGQCGCEGQLLQLSYTRSEFVRQTVTYGVILGAVLGGLPGFGDDAALASVLTGLSLTSAGIVTSAERLTKDPHNACAWLDLTISVLGAITASKALYGLGGVKTAIVSVADVEATGSALRYFLGQMRSVKTPSTFEALIEQNGIQFSKSLAANGEPSYNLSGFPTRLQIRLHLNSDDTISQFRVGMNLFPAEPINAFTVNPADEPALHSLDQQLRFLYGKPNNMPPRPGGWPGDFIDVFGYVYLDENGFINGLRTDAVHIKPIK